MATTCLSNRPLYLQVRDAVAERIATGTWKIGIAIPNEGDLAREFGVSVGTVRKSLGLLEEQHILTRQQGRGTFVNDRGSRQPPAGFRLFTTSMANRSADEVELRGDGRRHCEESWNAIACDLGRRIAVYRIRRVRLRKERPFMVEEVALPAALFPGLPENNGSSLGIALLAQRYGLLLAQRYGLLLGKAEERLTIAAAAPAVASRPRRGTSHTDRGAGPRHADDRGTPDRVADGSLPLGR